MSTANGNGTDLAATLKERGSRHGEFRDHARYTQSIKRLMASSPNWTKTEDMHREALEMIAHKIGRILAGDPNYADNWHDIAGYAKLVDDRLQQAVEFPFGHLALEGKGTPADPQIATVRITHYQDHGNLLAKDGPYCDDCEQLADFQSGDHSEFLCSNCLREKNLNPHEYFTLEH